MQHVPSVLGGPNSVMPIGLPGQGLSASSPQSEGLIDLTQPKEAIKAPDSVDIFGPPGPGQAGYEEWKVAQRGGGQSVGQLPPGSVARDEVPRQVALDPSPHEAMASVAEALIVPDPAVSYEPTDVTFVLSEGVVRCSYPLVILNEAGTCLVLGALDPPPGVALFSPTAAANLEVVVGRGQNALRYVVVSFDASFKIGEWNLLVLAIVDGPHSD